MNIVTNFFLASLIIIGCNPVRDRSKISEDNIQQNRLDTSRDYSAIYENAQNDILFKLIRFTKSLYYFELYDTNKINMLNKKRQILGVFKLKNDTFKIINTTATLNNFITLVDGDSSLRIDTSKLQIYDDFKDITGRYTKKKNNSILAPNYSLFIGSKWDECQFILNAKFRLYSYPSLNSISNEIKASKNDWCDTYIEVTNSDSFQLDFAYIKMRINNASFVGWIKGDEYYTILKRVFKCEKSEDGSIEKWDKENRFTLYYDSTGNFLKRVND